MPLKKQRKYKMNHKTESKTVQFTRKVVIKVCNILAMGIEAHWKTSENHRNHHNVIFLLQIALRFSINFMNS